MKIVLLGYMGSGKSTVSKLLAQKLQLAAIDLDEYIEKSEGKSIQQIFKDQGEIYFRNQENKYLTELLNKKENFVLALGGGTPCYANNMDLIKNKAASSFYLKAGLNNLFERLRHEKEQRPLIALLNDEKLKEFIAKHLFERAPYYEQADQLINIDDKVPSHIVDEITALL